MAKFKGGLGKGLSALIPGEETSRGGGGKQSRASGGDALIEGSIARLPISRISPNPFQPRADFDQQALDELKESIRENGIIQPVTVRRTKSGDFDLISGERRIRACTELGLTEIPAYIIEIKSDQEMLELALIENLQREHLNPIEIAISYERLVKDVGLSAEAIAAKVSKDRTTVVNFLRLLRLPAAIQDSLRKGEITIGHARALISVPDAKAQMKLYMRVVKKGLNVRQVEKLVRDLGKKTEKKQARPKSAGSAIDDLAQRMQQILATRVRVVTEDGEKGYILVEFYSTDDLGRLFDLISTIEH